MSVPWNWEITISRIILTAQTLQQIFQSVAWDVWPVHTHVMPMMKMKVRSSFCGVPVFRCQSMGIGWVTRVSQDRSDILRIATHQDQEGKIGSSVDGTNDDQE